MGLTKKEVLWCQHHQWYRIYRRHCIRTEFLACDDTVLDYLKSSQSLQLPIEEPGFAEPKVSKTQLSGSLLIYKIARHIRPGQLG